MSEEKSEVKVKDLRILLDKYNSDLGAYINAGERYRLGRVLTIVDASIADSEQRKAIKDLVNGEWWNSQQSKEMCAMNDPHSDIRAVCLALGFNLYPEVEPHELPGEVGMLEYIKKRYEDALKTSK